MSVGEAIPRPDGRTKVTGMARYACDNNLPGQLHARFVGSAIATGRVLAIDTRSALAHPGVVRVLTAVDMPRFGPVRAPVAAQDYQPMQDDRVLHEGQPIAIVLAETLEAAERGARLIDVRYERAQPHVPGEGPGVMPLKTSHFAPEELDFHKGDLENGFARATVRVDATYVQPPRHHNPMECSGTVAVWSGSKLTVHDAVQHVYGVRTVLSAAFKMPAEDILVLCPHTGGGFGCKGFVWPHQILIPAAARIVGRPVKALLTRAEMYAMVGHQPHMRHRMQLGADAAGRLTAVQHDTINATGFTADFVELATSASKGVYASPAIATTQRIERGHITMPTAMRAPVEGPGLWGLESAIDELAHELHMDPLDLRLANYAETDPATGRPWSSKKLREAYEEGAALFGWRQRPKTPQRDGRWIVSQGMATCSMGTFRFVSKARVRLRVDGRAVIETGTHDIGTGTLTIFPQIAADVLGIPVERIELILGDTRLPEAGPTYGSSTTMGVGAAVLNAAKDVRSKLARIAGLDPERAEVAGGEIRDRGATKGISVRHLMDGTGIGEIVGNGEFGLPGAVGSDAEGGASGYAMRTFGAVFLELGLDPDLGIIRLRRLVGSYSVGRILNPRTARSQIIGGMVWGWGMATMEESPIDVRAGRFLSKNLSGVAVPVNADIPSNLKVHFVDEVDNLASPVGGKGIGEISATGIAAAVANAVFAASGKRIRELPITPAKLLA